MALVVYFFNRNMRKLVAKSIAIAAALVGGMAQPAQALDFFFSFNNVNGTTNGTVSGRIIGLEDNTPNQMADNVFIDDFPAGLGGAFNNMSNDALTWSNVAAHSFTVTNGNLTSANFNALDTSNSETDFLRLNFAGTTNNLSLDGFSTSVSNFNSLTGLTFTPVPFEFEFEASLGLMALSAIFGGFAYLKKRPSNKLAIKS
jgi:hypothetical protein